MDGAASWAAETNDSGARADGDPIPSIAPGTVITMANWQKYRDFMPEGMITLFEGNYFWKMPADIQIEIAPTVIHPLPKNYLAATEKYASQVKIVERPDGGLTVQGYMGGRPFPNPQEPHKGWKVLLNLWYRYTPSLLVDEHAPGCSINQVGSLRCQVADLVYRQLSYETDDGIPTGMPAQDAIFATEWFMMVEPEDLKYTTTLVISYADLARPEDYYAYVPALRRYQQVSSAGRCGENSGTDFTSEDLRSGFDSNLTEIQADYVARRKMIAYVDSSPPDKPFPEGFFMPLAWPKPSWAKWQVRDVDVVNIKKIPSKASGYCYGNRVLYADAHFSGPLWEELYDSHMKLWKIYEVAPQLVDVPGIGRQNVPGGDMEEIWDLQNNHATFAAENTKSLAANENAPAKFHDLPRYTTPAGLNLINQ
jgi:Protein of unknown function (DUF1329)